MSDDRPGSSSDLNYLSAADTTHDPLRRLRIWLTKCRRHAQAPPASEIGDMISLAIAEIEKLRGVVERMQGQQREPADAGRSLRVGGGMAR